MTAPDAETVTAADVDAARERIHDHVYETPMWPNRTLSDRAGAPVWLKCENLQRTGSFKIRGATNMLAALDECPAGVIAASAGNHAQGVALAAQQLGVPATVVMPARAPLAKRQATAGYGATVELLDGSLADCQTRARELAAERDLFGP